MYTKSGNGTAKASFSETGPDTDKIHTIREVKFPDDKKLRILN
jgi:hypothetical protein